MLLEIKCDKFKIQPKRFNSGLNIVVGSDDGGNSIGKSTFLMILDFVFGGSDYLEKSFDVHQNLGEHNVFFAFKFKSKISYYCRNTLEKNIVYICDENYKKIDKITLENYLNILKNSYQVTQNSISFRNEVGRFFRIYGRENLQEKNPLSLFNAESSLKSVNSLLKLFDKYALISQIEKKYEDSSKEKDTILKADTYKLIKKIGKNKYTENLKRIEEITLQIEEILRTSEEGLIDSNSIITEEVLHLKDELSRLKISRSKYDNEMNKLALCKSEKLTEKQYNQIKEYFPEINLLKLEEVESFHDSIKTILNSEIESKMIRYSLIIKEISEDINVLEQKIKEKSELKSLSKNVLLRLSTLQREFENLKDENILYERYELVKVSINDLKNQIILLKNDFLNEIQAKLNGKMEELNDYIYNSQNKAPIISFDYNKYSFKTPDDTGTGTSYKSMIVFDLAVLNLTNLPVLIHDSYLLKQIQDLSIEKILELYINSNKQIFISIDKVSSLTEKSRKIIKENQVLELRPNGNELFGLCWNKK